MRQVPRKIIITAGGTMEPIDPVRVIANRSSGKMGMALLEAALRAGLSPVLIYANISVPLPEGKYRSIHALTAEEMYKVVKKEFTGNSILVMAAAVSDFKPFRTKRHKIKKGNDRIFLELVPGRDILKAVSLNKKNRFIAGFSAETDNILENSLKKMREKRMDLLVINDVGRKETGFGSDDNEVELVDSSGRREHLKKAPKAFIARAIIRKILALVRDKSEEQ
jgi:phosphopantothenoylcysteine decarboxylase / phosphopantothenate---cysteine ligase